MQHYTTIEQSKKLVELGLNPDTADMIIVKDNTYCNALSAFNGATLCQNYSETKNKTNYIPCWSLVALIDLIPNGIHWYLDENGLTIAEVDHYKDGKEVYIFRELYHNPVDAIVWLLENNYIKSNLK